MPALRESVLFCLHICYLGAEILDGQRRALYLLVALSRKRKKLIVVKHLAGLIVYEPGHVAIYFV